MATSTQIRTITVAGGNVFALAAKYLGDATQWNRICALNPQLNGDFLFTGTVTLKIPPRGASNGGILGL